MASVDDISDEALLLRAVKNCKTPAKTRLRWVIVMERFGLGSTYAAQLCRRFGLDPDEAV